jgi:ATP-dependent helicase/DNAse subunit B
MPLMKSRKLLGLAGAISYRFHKVLHLAVYITRARTQASMSTVSSGSYTWTMVVYAILNQIPMSLDVYFLTKSKSSNAIGLLYFEMTRLSMLQVSQLFFKCT